MEQNKKSQKDNQANPVVFFMFTIRMLITVQVIAISLDRCEELKYLCICEKRFEICLTNTVVFVNSQKYLFCLSKKNLETFT